LRTWGKVVDLAIVSERWSEETRIDFIVNMLDWVVTD
jgi:hypothetical protein